MDDVKEKLVNLLIKIFQFENEDLDFGVYKILNYKKDEISQFIQKDLIEEIKNQLDLISSEEKKSLEKELEQLKKQLQELGIQDYEKNPKYITKKEELKNLQVSENLEKEIYNHIYTFFSRYYDKGDFISKRRYGRTNKYAIPYNGEETLLYWANNDQYYIKTSEFLQKYSFRIPDLKINFRIAEAEEEKGNVKSDENKYFIVLNDPVYTYEDKELSIYLEYRGLTQNEKKEFKRPNQDKINKYNIEVIIDSLNKELKLEKLLQTDENEKTILEKHLNRYTARNTYDYFIHKDLKRFLDRELDFYIKNEILDLSDLTSLEKDHFYRYILEIKVIKNISSEIIDFLAQIENFQKNLWEKKKFVLSTNYCLTLDCIDEKYYPTIIENTKQVEEWKNLYNFDINEEKRKIRSNINGYSEENPEMMVLRNNLSLIIDTKFFDDNFKFKVLSNINNLDDKILGLLINSDNYHALNILVEKYYKKVKCCYIDPPYNAKSSEILYKNTFKHSSWLSLIENRITLMKSLLDVDGILIVAIDENEQERLGNLLQNVFPDYEKTCVTIVHNPRGIQGKNFSYCHEYAYFIYPDSLTQYIGTKPRENPSLRNLRDNGGESLRTDAKTCFYPFYVKNDQIIKIGDVPSEDFHPDNQSNILDDGTIEVWPIDGNGIERKWRYSNASVQKILQLLKVKKSRDTYQIHILKDEDRYKTVWNDKRYDANEYGTKLLGKILGKEIAKEFSFPKSLYNVRDCLHATTQDSKNALILDFFAGSGTTGNAVLNINRDDGGNRKFILIEMGYYFETVLVPRIKKILFSQNWKDGKPLDNVGIKKSIIKYQKLEQYEDSLENIEFSQKVLDEFGDYFVRYMLDFETRDSNTFLNIDKMENPFDYKINVLDDYQLKSVPVDLPETYNYLISLEVNKISTFENENDNNRKYLVIQGNKGSNNILVIWRDIRNFDPQKDRDFLDENVIKDLFDEIHLNGDSLIPDAILIEENFKKLMNGS